MKNFLSFYLLYIMKLNKQWLFCFKVRTFVSDTPKRLKEHCLLRFPMLCSFVFLV